jgi:hypothetical protein
VDEYKEWQKQAIALHELNLMSWREIAKTLKIPRSTVSDFLRAYKRFKEVAAKDGFSGHVVPQVNSSGKKHDNSRILCISDMHIPYQHKDTLLFLQMLKDRYEPTRVICLGDEIDHHAMSFHDSDPDLMSAGDELKKALEVIAELHKMFPEMDLIDSNHGSMAFRRAKHHGVPRHYLKSYNEVLEVGEGWVWHNDLVIELPDGQQVYFHHGKSQEAIKTSQSMSMSHVCGHFHESFGVKYWANPNGLFWAMNSGCLIDDSSLAFAYNNVNLKRPIIGTSLIIDGVPILEAMPL